MLGLGKAKVQGDHPCEGDERVTPPSGLLGSCYVPSVSRHSPWRTEKRGPQRQRAKFNKCWFPSFLPCEVGLTVRAACVRQRRYAWCPTHASRCSPPQKLTSLGTPCPSNPGGPGVEGDSQQAMEGRGTRWELGCAIGASPLVGVRRGRLRSLGLKGPRRNGEAQLHAAPGAAVRRRV